MKPLVSICIPAYNNAKYISMCIESALNQTYSNIEVILVEDCSTDNALSIANKYKDKIKILVNEKNLGQPKNTNKCIELSRGKYLVILHSDDVLLPNMVEDLVPILEDHPTVGMAVGERLIIDENNNVTEIAPFYNIDCIIPGIEQARIFMMTSYLTCQVLIRRKIIDKVGGVDERHIANLDGLLWFKCSLEGDMAYIQDRVCWYRIHPEQTTAYYNRTINHMMEYYIVLSEMFRLAKGKPYLEEFFDTAIKRVAELTVRYSCDGLEERNYDLVRRYLILATVFDEEIVNTEKYKLVKSCLESKDSNPYKGKSKYRNFSYSPPKGSIEMGKKIIIYGAGKIGRSIHRSLLRLGFKDIVFWDKYADTMGIENVIKPNVDSIPSEHRDDYLIIVTIYSEEISKEISNDLLSCGYKNVIYDRETINSLIYHGCKTFDINKCHICPIHKDKCDIFVKTFSNNNEVVIPTLGVLVSNKCNLSCSGCNHLRYLYERKDNIELSFEEIIKDLTKIVDASDLVCRVVIVGGEAFLHPNLYTILEDILKLPKVGYIHIITNGTVMPKNKEIFKLLSNKRIIVEMSDYRNNLSKRLRDNFKRFMLELDEHNVNYLLMSTLQWYDFGTFDKRFYSKEQHSHVYKTCCFVSNDLFKGKLHKCSRSNFGNLLKRIPDYPNDYVDVRNCQNLRDELIEFLNNELPEVCQHCNGVSVKMSKAGGQRV